MQRDDLKKLLLGLSDNGVRFFGPESLPQGDPPAGKFEEAFYPRHKHGHLELACLLSGSVTMQINGRWQVCKARLSMVFIPGAVHTEHYILPDKPYRMLWGSLLPSTLAFHVTEYNPLSGYSTSRRRLVIAPLQGNQLWQITRMADFARNRVRQARFHALWMECVAYFLENESRELSTADHHQQVVEQIKHYVDEYYWENISLSKIASMVHYVPGHLNSIFRRFEKMPLHRYINYIRLLRSYEMLQRSDVLVKQVARAVGFQDPLYFSRLFKRQFGISPSEAALSADHKKQPRRHQKQKIQARRGAEGKAVLSRSAEPKMSHAKAQRR